jgi:hypothetical protein
MDVTAITSTLFRIGNVDHCMGKNGGRECPADGRLTDGSDGSPRASLVPKAAIVAVVKRVGAAINGDHLTVAMPHGPLRQSVLGVELAVTISRDGNSRKRGCHTTAPPAPAPQAAPTKATDIPSADRIPPICVVGVDCPGGTNDWLMVRLFRFLAAVSSRSALHFEWQNPPS